MTILPWPSRQERDFQWHLKMTSLNIMGCYKKLQPEVPAVDFAKAIQNFVETMLEPSIENPLEILLLFFPGSDKGRSTDEVTQIARSTIGPVIVACVYCIRAREAMESENFDLAWSYMADAQYWCGISVCDKDIGAGLKQIINTERDQASVNALSSKGKAAAEAQNVPYERLRAYVYKEARKPEARWTSRAHAAGVISKKAIKIVNEENEKAKADGRKSRLSKIKGEESFKQTLEDSWLKDMSDASSLFTPKKSKS